MLGRTNGVEGDEKTEQEWYKCINEATIAGKVRVKLRPSWRSFGTLRHETNLQSKSDWIHFTKIQSKLKLGQCHVTSRC